MDFTAVPNIFLEVMTSKLLSCNYDQLLFEVFIGPKEF